MSTKRRDPDFRLITLPYGTKKDQRQLRAVQEAQERGVPLDELRVMFARIGEPWWKPIWRRMRGTA